MRKVRSGTMCGHCTSIVPKTKWVKSNSPHCGKCDHYVDTKTERGKLFGASQVYIYCSYGKEDKKEGVNAMRKVEYGMCCTAIKDNGYVNVSAGGCEKCDYYVDAGKDCGDPFGCSSRYVVCSYLEGEKKEEMKLKRLVLEKTYKSYQCIHISELMEKGLGFYSLLWLTKQPQFEKHMRREDIVNLLRNDRRIEDLKWLNQHFPIEEEEDEVVYGIKKHIIIYETRGNLKRLLFVNSDGYVSAIVHSYKNKIDFFSQTHKDDYISGRLLRNNGEDKYYAIETDEQLAWVFKNYFSIEGEE